MANPDFVDESVADQGGAGPFTVLFPAAWAANQIALIFVSTDGWIPTLTTANGFAIATDVNGNAASVTTNGGVAGASECGMFVFWKRLVGSNSTTDPAPVIGAAPGGSTMAIELNTYSGCRTTGNPFHIIATGTAASSTSITSPSVTPTLNACTLVTAAASANDDQAFNSWTFTGSASPAGTLDSGWHDATGNACAFVGGRGGYATAGGARVGTSSFAAASKQALVTIVLASLNEVFGPDDSGDVVLRRSVAVPVQAQGWPVGGDELPAQISSVVDDDGGQPVTLLPSVTAAVRAITVDDDLPLGAAASIVDEDAPVAAQVAWPTVSRAVASVAADDELPIATSGIVDDDVAPAAKPSSGTPTPWFVAADDEFPGGATPSGLAEDVGVLVFASPPPPPIIPVPVLVEEVPAQPGVTGIGGASDAQRSFLAPPQTGTLSTIAPLPAWTTSHAYVIDPSQGGINRIQNGGNHYQCTQDGTSAGSGGGPSGTGTAIADGTTVWRFIGPVQSTNTAAGSQILCTVMRGNESQAATVAPTDNDGGGTYTLITDNQYTNFTGSFAGVWRRPTASNAKTNFQTSGVWGGSGGAGDEMSIGWIEIQGVSVGAPHASSHVERLASSGGTVTAAAITTTVPCVIVSYWFGNGTVQTAGQPDAATPAGGLTLIAGSTGMLSLTTSGYVQHMVAWRKQATPAINFSEVWTASPTDEGAQLVTIAYQDLNAAASISVDDQQLPQVCIAAGPPMLVAPVAVDELAPTGALGSDDGQVMPVPVAAATIIAVPSAPDELAILTMEDDVAPLVGMPSMVVPMLPLLPPAEESVTVAPPALEESALLLPMPLPVVPLAIAVAIDEIALSAVLDEDGAPSFAPAVTVPPLAPVPIVDEVPTVTVTSAVDDDLPPMQVASVATPPIDFRPAVDELPVVVPDEDASLAPVLRAPIQALAYSVGGDDEIPVIPLFDDAGALFALTWNMALPVTLPSYDELPGPAVTSGLSVDDDLASAAALWLPLVTVAAVTGYDELPVPSVPPVDPTTAWEDAIYRWVLTGSGLAPDHVIWASAGAFGPAPAGLYISMRIIDVDQISDDWLIPRREGGGIVHHVRGTRHPMLELRCFAGDSTGARRAELVLSRVMASVMLPSVTKALRKGDVGVGTCGKVRVINGTRSGMLDPLALVEVELHIKIDVSEAGAEFTSADVTTPGGVAQTVEKP